MPNSMSISLLLTYTSAKTLACSHTHTHIISHTHTYSNTSKYPNSHTYICTHQLDTLDDILQPLKRVTLCSEI